METQEGEIGENEWLLRRIPPGEFKKRRPNSNNFDEDPDGSGTSVTLRTSKEDEKITMEGHEGFGLVAIRVGDLPASVKAERRPLDDNANHCEICGSRTRGDKRKMAGDSRWIIYPEHYPADEREEPFTFDE